MKTTPGVMIHLTLWLTAVVLCAIAQGASDVSVPTLAWIACGAYGLWIKRAHHQRCLSAPQLSIGWGAGAAVLLVPLSQFGLLSALATEDGLQIGLLEALPVIGVLMAFNLLLDHLGQRQLPKFKPMLV